MTNTKCKLIGGGEEKEGQLSKREQLEILYQDSCKKGIMLNVVVIDVKGVQ